MVFNILTLLSMWEIRMRYFRSLAYFHSFEALHNAFEVQFFRDSFVHPITDTDDTDSM